MKNCIHSKKVLGIDLGTCNTGASCLSITGIPEMIPIEGHNIMPSITYFGTDLKSVEVGRGAANMRMFESERVVAYAKRDVGTDKVYFQVDGVDITPGKVQAEQLRKIREVVEKEACISLKGCRVVITVPASTNEAFRQSVCASAKEVGFGEVELINEPTAAAYANGFFDKSGDRLMIFLDFGGGTFDVSIGRMQSGELTMLASVGDKELGGRDVNDLILGEVLSVYEKDHGVTVTFDAFPNEYFMLDEEVERQKGMLSSQKEVTIFSCISGAKVQYKLTRAKLAKLCRPLLERINLIIDEALFDASVDVADIDHVLFVGGSTRLRFFEENAEKRFGKDKLFQSPIARDLCVAKGAALLAAQRMSEQGKTIVNESLQAIPLPNLRHQDVTANSLGVAVQDPKTGELVCSVIVGRNTLLPVTEVKSYASVNDTQTEFRVCVLQGEAGMKFDDCLVVGEKTLTLPARSMEKPSLDVRIGYDRSNMVSVTVFDTVSKLCEDITVDFNQVQLMPSASV